MAEASTRDALEDAVVKHTQDRSTQQGVVRGLINKIQSVIKEGSRADQKTCEDLCARLLDHRGKHDVAYNTLKDLKEQLHLDNTEIDAKAKKLTIDTAAVYQDAQNWLLKIIKKTDSTAAKAVPVAGATTEPAEPKPATGDKTTEIADKEAIISAKDQEIHLLRVKLGELSRDNDLLEDTRYELSITKSTVISQEAALDKERQHWQSTMADLQSRLSQEQTAAHGVQRDLDDERYRADELQSKLDVVEQRSRDSFGIPSAESTRTSMGSQDMFNLSQIIAQSNKTVIQQVLDHTTDRDKTFYYSMQSPKIELKEFTGDMTEYHAFICRFDDLVGKTTMSDAAKLNTLQQYCGKEVRRHLDCCDYKSPAEGLVLAREILKNKFGNPFLVSQAWVEKMMQYGVMKKADELLRFSSELKSCQQSLSSLGYLSDLENTANMRSLVSKIPSFVQNRYRKKNRDNVKKGVRTTLEQLIDIVTDAAEELVDPIYGPDSIKKLTYSSDKPADKKPQYRARGSVNAVQTGKSESATGAGGKAAGSGGDRAARKIKCSFCKEEHFPRLCPRFKPLNSKEKLKMVKSRKLCLLCLNPYHEVQACLMKWTCQRDGCKARHNTVLHDAFVSSRQDDDDGDDDDDDSSSKSSTQGAALHTSIDNSYSLPVTPVMVQGVGGDYETNVLVDTGATATFMTRSFFKRAGLKASGRDRFHMTTMGQPVSWEGDVVNFNIRAVDSPKWKGAFSVAVVDELPVSNTYVSRITELEKWPYLEKLNMGIPLTKEVGILLGQSNARLFKTNFTVEGPGDCNPYAVRMPIGWAIMGHYVPQPVSGQVSACSEAANVCVLDDGLENQLSKFWQVDDVPEVKHEDPVNVKIVKNWGLQATMIDGHLQVPIPVKNDPPDLPNNYVAVKKRFDSLTRRLQHNDVLKEQYVKAMRAMFDKGYAEECGSPPRYGYLWYHPQQPVINERRPGKCRIVGDLSIIFEGKCLNKEVHQGPNYTASIVNVVTQFRMYEVAITGDIREMFSQVVVPPEQRDLLRFLWFKDDEVGGEIVECRMTTHPFGGIWCPAAAMYVFRWIVDNIADEQSEEVIAALLRDFYVDDFLKSVVNHDMGLRLLKEVRQLLDRVGYDLVKLGSSDKFILDSLPPELRAKEFQELELSHKDDTITHTLGSVWKPIKDVLSFRTIELDKPFTRRGVLSTTSSLYDPLGLIAPFVLRAKIFLQRLCKARLQWDEPIPAVYNPDWKAWLADVPRIKDFSVPRWIGITDDVNEVRRLHMFTDASQSGFGAAVYLVVSDGSGVVRSSNLIMSKAKVSPMNTMTIPRLELSAAVLGVKLERAVRDILTVPLQETKFWSDSMIVLWYVRGQAWKFKTFVANRISYLQEHTDVTQWHYVPTDLNPADKVSRGLSAEEIISDVSWIKGPAFLLDPDRYPEQPELKVQKDKAELRTRPVCVLSFTTAWFKPNLEVKKKVLESCSSWSKLLRSICIWKRFVTYLKTCKVSSKHYTPKEFKSAELVAFTWIQQEYLSEGQKKSKIFRKLFPFGQDGLLRVGGRLMLSSLTFQAKHPPTLPDSPATRVFIRYIHERNGHAGVDRTFYDLRAHVWILGGKSPVKSTLSKCVWCKRMRGKMAEQVMSPLPKIRVTPGTVPFKHVGIDYCGPFMVKVGRSFCKRYVCTITCLQSRAVHFEVAFFLTTTSFLHALQRFIARRGKPESILSDNGSNFVGAKRELREALQSFNQRYIGRRLTEEGIDWKFNVPLASHHSGVWERMNRSYRSTFQAIAGHQVLTDETLPTFAAAAEQVLNSRPLTKVAEDSQDLEVITPNHLLSLSKVKPIHGQFEKGDVLRGHWQQIQYLSDLFWRRWKRTYLQSLQVRQKWTSPSSNLRAGEIVLVMDGSRSLQATAHKTFAFRV